MSRLRESPWWYRILNRGWRYLDFQGTRIDLGKDSLIRAARKMTGLDDYGTGFNDEPLDRLLDSIEHEAELSPAGRFITRQRFISLLAIRLRAEYYFRKYPQILDQELYPAWFIVGLQRTGTTKLQRLLAEDPRHRVIPSWEVINPVPLSPDLYDLSRQGQNGNHDFHSVKSALSHSAPYPKPGDKRIGVARTSVNALKYISPGFFAVHPIDVMQPEEDILLLDISFMSTTPEAMMHVPSYSSWLEQTDQSQAYAYMVRMLKFLQWIRPAQRWILKSPHHLEFPELISRHFGEVHFIWPHRRIYECIPSYLSMVTYNRRVFSDRVNEQEVAGHWVRKIGYMLQQAIDYRVKPGNTRKFTDLAYHELVQNSATELTKIYRQDGGMTPELLERFRQHEEAHPHRKYGVHQYSLSDFGLTNQDIDVHTLHYQQFIKEIYGDSREEKV